LIKLITFQANSAMQRNKKPSIWDRYAASSRPHETQPPPASPNAGVIGPPDSDFGGQPKYVPFWQRLLKRKQANVTSIATTRRPKVQTPDPEDLSGEAQEEENDGGHEELDEDDEEQAFVAVATTTQPTTTQKSTTRRPVSKRRRLKPARTTLGYELVDEEEDGEGFVKTF
jgi:hypothetical protein